jgi:hypothetical protein
MNIIKEFSEYFPKKDLVSKYKEEISDKYEVIFDKMSGYKLVLIDDKIHYLTGPFRYKNKLMNRIYFDLNDSGTYHEASLRKAIKEWVSENTI